MTREHGTRQGYRGGCRCLSCRAANAFYEATRADRPAYEGMALVPAGRAIAHLQTLKAAGLGVRRIAALAGLGQPSGVSRLLNGQVTHIQPITEMKILSVKPLPALDTPVEATDTRLLLERLRREGFTHAEIARRLGRRFRIRLRRGRVRLRIALSVRLLHRIVTQGDDSKEGER